MKKIIKWIVILSLIGGGLFWFFNSKKNKETETTVTYDRVTVELRDVSTTVESTGEVQPRNRLDVKPPIAGRLEELLVDEGDAVIKGQILGWVSSTERATLLDAALATSEEELAYWQDLYKPTPLISPIEGTVIARNFEPGQSINANDVVVVIADDLIVVANLDETDIGQVKLEQQVEVNLEAYPDDFISCEVEKIAYDARTISNVTMYEVDVRPFQLPSFARSGMTANLKFVLEERLGVRTVVSSAIKEITAPDGEEDPESEQPKAMDEERRKKIAAKMRESGMSDEEIKQRVEAFKKKGGKRPSPIKRGSLAEVLVASDDPEAPETRQVKTGLSDGRYTEILDGLEEGDEVWVEKIITGQHKSSRSPFMPKRKK